jgi:hypothetical protein
MLGKRQTKSVKQARIQSKVDRTEMTNFETLLQNAASLVESQRKTRIFSIITMGL